MNVNEGSNDASLIDTRLFWTRPSLRQGAPERAQLGTDAGSRRPACGYSGHAHPDPLNCALPGVCVTSVQETVTQILQFLPTQPKGSWKERRLEVHSGAILTPQPLCTLRRHFVSASKADLPACETYYSHGTHTVPTPNIHGFLVSRDPGPPGRASIYRPRTKTPHREPLAMWKIQLTEKATGPGVIGPGVGSWSHHHLIFDTIHAHLGAWVSSPARLRGHLGKSDGTSVRYLVLSL